MKKKDVFLFSVFLLSFVLINAVFAQSTQRQSARGDIYVGYYQIMNMETLDIYRQGSFETEKRHFSVDQAKEEIRGTFGFPSGSDVRKINGVDHKIIWTNVRRK